MKLVYNIEAVVEWWQSAKIFAGKKKKKKKMALIIKRKGSIKQKVIKIIS